MVESGTFGFGAGRETISVQVNQLLLDMNNIYLSDLYPIVGIGGDQCW